MTKRINIAIVDDHEIIRNGLAHIIDGKNNISVVLKAANGREFIELLSANSVEVNIALIDISMPEMDGFETTKIIVKDFNGIKPICLSVNNDFESVFKMIDSGAKAYLPKDCTESYLSHVINKVYSEGNYFDSFVVEKMKEFGQLAVLERNTIKSSDVLDKISEKELTFLKLCCSEKTYKEIAFELNVSLRTVDGYRESLFSKLDMKSRVGLVLFAIENGIYIPRYRF